MASTAKKPNDGTVGKALDVLDQVASYGRPVRFGELLEKSDFPKATLYRFVQTLTNQQMLTHEPATQTYRLGVRLLELAHSAWSQSTMAPIARPHLRSLAVEVGETIHLAQMHNGQVIFIDKYRTADQFETLAQTGMIAPSYCTGVGKAILAFLPPEQLDQAILQQAFHPYTSATLKDACSLIQDLEVVRKQGFAFDREEHQTGVISIATPILSSTNKVLGALSIATSTNRHSLASLESFLPQLIDTAKKIGCEAAVWQYPT